VRQRWIAISLVASAAAILGLGCGADDQPKPRVVIEVDGSAEGDPALLGGPAGDSQQQRVPITPEGIPTAVFAARVRDVASGDELRVLSTVTVTKCHETDYDPRRRSYTGCEFTHRYGYNPIDVETRFRLVSDSAGKPDLGSGGVQIGETNRTTCTDLKHHCTVIDIGEAELGDSAEGLDWVVLEMTASSPKASACRPRKPARCEVLAVEVQKGTAMYVVDVRGEVEQPDSLPRDRTADRGRLPVVNDESEGASRQAGRQVVYSIPLSEKGREKDLLGDQFEVGALLRVGSETRAYAPLITSYIVLASRPTAVEGRYLVSDSYSPARTGNTGENCSGKCAYLRGAAATVILPCDVRAGRRFVNLVAGAARDVAPSGRTARILEGGLRVVRYYDDQVSANSTGRC
jgi:hypothetical protein